MILSKLSRLFWQLSLLVGLLLSILVLLLALWFPKLPEYHPQIEQWLSTILEQPITIGKITTDWAGFMPVVALQQVRLLDESGKKTVIEIAEAEMVLNLFASIQHRTLITDSLIINGSQFTLARHRDGSISLVGLPKKESSNNPLPLLLQQQHISLPDTTVTWLEPSLPPLIFSNLKLTLERQHNGHQITGRVTLPQHPVQGLQAKTFWFDSQLTLENRHQLTKVQGQFAVEQLQFVSTFSQTKNSQYPSKKNSQTLTGEFQVSQQTDGTWQIDLKQQLTSYNQQPWLTHQVQAKIVSVVPKTATQSNTRSIELNGTIQKLSLEKLMSVVPPELSNAAHSELPDILAATQGTLHDIQWKVVFPPTTMENMTGNPVSSETLNPPPVHWQVQARFTDLSTPPVGQIPDITGLAGHIELEPNQGTLSFEQTAVTLKFSDQYTYPLWLQLNGAIHWQRDQQQLTVTMKELQAIDKQTNMTVQVAGHLDVPVDGGMVNKQLSVTLRNGQLSQLLKYLPEQRHLPKALHPLTTAQLTGQLSQAELLIQGRGEQTHVELNGDFNQLSLSNYPISDQLQTSVTLNDLSGHLNIQPEQGTLELLNGTVTLNMPSQYQQPLSLAQLKGRIDWKRTQNQWQLTTQQLQAIDNQMTLQARGQISIPLLGGHPDSQLSITLHNGQLSQFTKYLPKLFQEQQRRLQQAQLGGQLSQAHIKIRLQKGQPTQFQFKGQINQLSVTNYQLPGANKPTITINELSAQLNLKPNHGALRLFNGAITLNLPSTHSHPISLTQLTGTLRWQRQQQQWQITAKKLQAIDNTMKIKVIGGIEIPQQGGMPKADVKIMLHNGQLSQIPAYLPDQKWRKMAHWFNNAELQGHISTAHIIIQGPLNALLDKGRFELKADLNKAHINYAQGWPSLSQLKAQVLINGRSFTVTAESGKLLDSNVQQMVVKIPDLSAPRLSLIGRTQGPAADGVRFVQQSPLHKSVNLNRLEMDGLLDVQLKLDLPFSKGQKKVQVLLTFQKTTLHDKSLKLTLTDVAGTVNFSNDKVLAEKMQGKLLGEPISFSVLTLRNQRPKRTTVKITGFANPHGLEQQLAKINPQLAQLPLHTLLVGRTHWSANLTFPNENVPGNNYTDIQLQADLLGIAIKLPAPLGKTADEQQPLNLSVRLFSEPEAHKNRLKSPINRKNSDSLVERTKRVGEEVLGTIQIRYGDRLNGLFRLNKTGLERGTLILGTTPAKLPKQALLNIEGHTSNLSITEWLTQLKALTPNTTKQPSSTPPRQLPITILTDIQMERVELPGQTFNHVALQAQLAPERWQASITGNGIEGQLSFAPTQKVPSLDLNFKQLTLTLPESATAPTSTEPQPQPAPPNPRHLISLSFHCTELQIGDIQLGKVDLQIQPDSDGLKLNLQALSPGANLQATGQWRYVAQRHQTLLQATLNSNRIDLMLQQFGLKKSPIIGEQGQITVNTYWQGAPSQFKLTNLVGTLSLVILEGQLVDIEPGRIGRVFGLFDVYTLPRRLALDFSDVFDKGFGFSALAGVFFIKEGRANTEHLILQAPVARVSISGQTHLIEKYYDQTVTVFPQLTNPLPIAGLLAGGLTGGAAALLVQLLLQPKLEHIVNFQYHITGPWETPKIAPQDKRRVGKRAE